MSCFKSVRVIDLDILLDCPSTTRLIITNPQKIQIIHKIQMHRL